MKPETYFVQNGCHNCRHVFEAIDISGGFFCAFKGPARPAWGTFESLSILEDKKAWDAWREGREVEAAGLCAKWEWNSDEP